MSTQEKVKNVISVANLLLTGLITVFLGVTGFFGAKMYDMTTQTHDMVTLHNQELKDMKELQNTMAKRLDDQDGKVTRRLDEQDGKIFTLYTQKLKNDHQ